MMSHPNCLAEALKHATDTRSVTIGSGVLAAVPDLFRQYFGDRAAIVVADETTFAVSGHDVHKRLANAGIETFKSYVFSSKPQLYADFRHMQALESALSEHDAIPVAVGSGTINDLTKLASHRCGRPYMAVATAASMDGYTAFGAAISRDGFKETFACPAPLVVVADLDVLKNAPPHMTASGYADLLGKVTAGADWIIADTLEIEPIDTTVWPMVQDSLQDWTGDPAALVHGDTTAFGKLIEGLMLTGLAMQSHRSSRPASGSEHQFSHLWEMGETVHSAVSHGFKVGIGSIAVAALYERVLQRDLATIDIPALCRNWPSRTQVEAIVRDAFARPQLQERAVEESLAKYVDADALARRLALLRDRWPTLRERLREQLLPAQQLRNQLAAASCPTHPNDIGKSLAQLKFSYALARRIRRRYTIFDLAVETGCFDECVDEIFAPGGFWPPKA